MVEELSKQLKDTYLNIGISGRILDGVRSSPAGFVGEWIRFCDSQAATEYQQVPINVWRKVNKKIVFENSGPKVEKKANSVNKAVTI